MAEMVRVNTRISSKLNDWLDQQSKETGLPKSTMVMLALEEYRNQREAMSKMGEVAVLMEKLKEIEKKY